jgi:hypothetical protein
MILAGRLVFEQTVWTWETGEQMVGYSLAHGYAVSLFATPVVMIVWLLVAIALIIRSALKKRRIAPSSWVALGLALAVLGTLLVPYTVWERIFVAKLAKSPHAAEFAVSAAYQGQSGALKYYLAHGVPVGAHDHDGKTPLHAAASAGRLELVEYLLAHGADVNALDRYGDSPLELAATEMHLDVAAYLTAHGAKRIKGDSAARDRAIEEMVSEDIAKAEGPSYQAPSDSEKKAMKRFMDSIQHPPGPRAPAKSPP